MAQMVDENHFKKLEHDWERALLAKDLAELDRILASDFVLVGIRSTGTQLITREVWLDTLLHKMRIEAFSASATRVRVYKDSAVVSMEGAWTLTLNGREIDENFLLTDVWVQQGDQWKVVLRHSSPFPKNAPAPK